MAKLWEILLEGRRRRNWSQLDLAFRAGVSASTVARTEQGRGAPNGNSLRRMAVAIGHDPDALVAIARDGEGEALWVSSPQAARPIPGVMTADHLASGSIAGYRDQPLTPPPPMVRVPHFGRVSAVRTDLRETAGLETSLVPDVGVDFTVSVDGQCMEPRYEDGERVGCSIRRWEQEGFVWGKDYWIRFRDGETTLKRVMADPDNHEKFICQPLNPAAEAFSRFKADVAKAARVLVVLPG
ncbi:MAG TPA: LexA family transcriptional regulator [Tepidisphaeraceae bacterium]|nr:LexA family transcriptional regulator [Tepidisphaeraceae bacterium]